MPKRCQGVESNCHTLSGSGILSATHSLRGFAHHIGFARTYLDSSPTFWRVPRSGAENDWAQFGHSSLRVKSSDRIPRSVPPSPTYEPNTPVKFKTHLRS